MNSYQLGKVGIVMLGLYWAVSAAMSLGGGELLRVGALLLGLSFLGGGLIHATTSVMMGGWMAYSESIRERLLETTIRSALGALLSIAVGVILIRGAPALARRLVTAP